MAKSHLRLDTRRPLRDGTYPVQICVGYGTNIYLSTGIFLHQDEWDSTTQSCNGKSARKINSVLQTLLFQVQNRILELREKGMYDKLSKAQLRQMLTNIDLSTPTVGVPTLGDMFEKVIGTKTGGTKMLFQQTLKKVTAYCGDPKLVYFSDINKSWLIGFQNSMTSLCVNSRAMHLRNLRNVINFAIDDGITQNYAFHNFHIPTEETAMRVLPIDKLRTLLSLKLDKANSEYRDIFALIIYLIGINLIDLSGLTTANIKDGRLEYRRAKTGKFYSIKIEPEAAAIIDKYKGKKHLLAPFDRYKAHTNYLIHLNKALAKMGPVKLDANGKPCYTDNHLPIMEPIEPGMTSYWGRYTWATYAADLDIPKDTISEALGHVHGSKITGVYIKFSRDKIDEANRKVIDYILQK